MSEEKKTCKHGEVINEGHYVEFIDRLHIVICNIDEYILNHPIACTEESYQKDIKQALHHLMECYQAAGADETFFNL